MVIAKAPGDVSFDNGRRYLDQEKIQSALDKATEFGAEYAEVRLVSITDSSVSTRDGQLERAIPGQEVGATMRILADGAWGVHSTTDISSIPLQVEGTVKLARAVASRRGIKDKPVSLAEVPIIEDSIHWNPKKDVRNTELSEKLEHLKVLHDNSSDDSKIASVICGWHDEHIHTEFMSSEGMNRVWSFQRSLVNATVTARDGSDVVSYRTRHGGEGGLELY